MRWFSIVLCGCLSAGCAEGPGLMAEWDAATAAAAGGAAPEAAAEEAATDEPKLVPITKREARLVDKQQALAENPALIEVENHITATDPLTAVAQSYFTIGSRAQVLAMQHNINIQRELNHRWPTFAEFQSSLQQSNVQLSALYAYQMYAYDETTGGLSILEDRAEMKRQYEAAGREYPHAD